MAVETRVVGFAMFKFYVLSLWKDMFYYSRISIFSRLNRFYRIIPISLNMDLLSGWNSGLIILYYDHESMVTFFGPVWLEQNQIWISKSGSWNHEVVIKQNVESESGF